MSDTDKTDTPETIADIVRKMRNRPFGWSMPSEIPGVEKCNCEAEKLADRIEAAAKRAHDIAAALLAAKGVMSPHPDPEHAPGPRNCDVGTAEEQLERWVSFCNRNWSRNYASRGLDPCDDCELVEFGNCRCQLAWAQMPYEEGGAE